MKQEMKQGDHWPAPLRELPAGERRCEEFVVLCSYLMMAEAARLADNGEIDRAQFGAAGNGGTGIRALLATSLSLAAKLGGSERLCCFPALVRSMQETPDLWNGLLGGAGAGDCERAAAGIGHFKDVEIISVVPGEILLSRRGPVLPVISFKGAGGPPLLNPGSGRRDAETLLPEGRPLLRNAGRRKTISLFPFLVLAESRSSGPSLCVLNRLTDDESGLEYRHLGASGAVLAPENEIRLAAAQWLRRRPELFTLLGAMCGGGLLNRSQIQPVPAEPGGELSVAWNVDSDELYTMQPVSIAAHVRNTGGTAAGGIVIRLAAGEGWSHWLEERVYRFDLQPGESRSFGFWGLQRNAGTVPAPRIEVEHAGSVIPSDSGSATVEVQPAPEEFYRRHLREAWEDAVLTGEEDRDLKKAREKYSIQLLESESIQREQKLHRLLRELKALDASIDEDISDDSLVLSYHDVVFARFSLQMGRIYLYLKGDSDLLKEVPYPCERTTDRLQHDFPLRVDLDQVREMADIVRVVECCLAVAREESGPLAKLRDVMTRLVLETGCALRRHPAEAITALSFCLPVGRTSESRWRLKALASWPEGEWAVRLCAIVDSAAGDNVERLREEAFEQCEEEALEQGGIDAQFRSHPAFDCGVIRLASGEIPGAIARFSRLLEIMKSGKTSSDTASVQAQAAPQPAPVQAAGKDPEEMYRLAIERAWADEVLTQVEADFLSGLHQRLGLSESKATALNRSFLFKKIQADLLKLLKHAVFRRKAHPSSGTSVFSGSMFDREFMLVEISAKTLSFYVLGPAPPWAPAWEGVKPIREAEPGRHWYRVPLAAIREFGPLRQLFKRAYLIALGDVAEELLSKPETGGSLAGAVEYLRASGDYRLSPQFVSAWTKLLEGDPRFRETEKSLVLDM